MRYELSFYRFGCVLDLAFDLVLLFFGRGSKFKGGLGSESSFLLSLQNAHASLCWFRLCLVGPSLKYRMIASELSSVAKVVFVQFRF